MTNLALVTLAALSILSVNTTLLAAQAPASDGAVMRVAQAPPAQQGEFIPIDQLPPQEQLPAAPLLVTAYAFVLVMLFGYVVSLSRRLTTIQREVDRLDADVKRGSGT